MKIIVDTNIFIAVTLNEPERQQILNITTGCSAVAPNLLPYEIGNAVSAMFKRKQLNSEQASQCFEYASKIPVQLVEVNIPKALSIALKNNIYAYDAYFLQAATQYGYPLLSLDNKMCKVAKELNIEVLEI